MVGNWTALRRGALALVAAPAAAMRDVRVGRWMRTLQ